MSGIGTRLLRFDVAMRREVTQSGGSVQRAPLAPLADSLAQDLELLINRELPIPEYKARLTRHGGRCPVHGTFLEFDPWSPHDHHCVRCARPYIGRAHDEWWAMGAQLWTAERAVHAASLFVLRGDARHGALAARILREYSERYHTWPNKDNVLGPTRPFFSTYLESIWLLNLCHALALLETTASEWNAVDSTTIRERLLEPSAALIASYHEGGSNRQVWNEVAIGSAWCLLDRQVDVRRRLDVEGGLRWQLANGLDEAGSWYEGENYHLFAHRGLWYGVELMRAMDEYLPPELNARYSAGFVAPFAGVLPDETFPSRRDSQYASSIRQWRTAEWCELGLTHTHSPLIAGLLSRLYDGRVARHDTGRARSTADAERNAPASALTRADLSWRALLMTDANPSSATALPPVSVCLPAQGLAVIRRDMGQTYVALEGGQLGGGHGHPDQLALTLQTGEARWLDDPGTGSYVEAELKWYRSSLAHAAPLVDRCSQPPVAATLVAFEDQGDAGWMVKRIEAATSGIAADVRMERTLVVCTGYLIDLLEWEAVDPHVIELPICGIAELAAGVSPDWTAVTAVVPRADQVTEFIRSWESLQVQGTVSLLTYPSFADASHASAAAWTTGSRRHHAARLWYAVDTSGADGAAYTVMRADVPAAPWHGRTQRHWICAKGQRGRLLGVWSWPSDSGADGVVSHVQLEPSGTLSVRVTTSEGAVDTHTRIDAGWHIARAQGADQREVLLSGFVNEPNAAAPTPTKPTPTKPNATTASVEVSLVRELPSAERPGTPIPGATTIALGEAHYVRTEVSWREAGSPSALVQLATTARELVVDVHAATGPLGLCDPNLSNPLDNEVPFVNVNGLQWYMAPADQPPAADRSWSAAALHAPSRVAPYDEHGRAIPIVGIVEMPRAIWREMPDGWAMRLCWPLTSLPIDASRTMCFELVVNERPPDRERRRGQLVLSGGGGYGYLMGDRRPVNRYVRLVLPFAPAETTLR